jgi:hypothetical protein
LGLALLATSVCTRSRKRILLRGGTCRSTC